MESKLRKWDFEGTKENKTAPAIKTVIAKLRENLNEGDQRSTISLGQGDPSSFKCFRTSSVVEKAVIDTVRSAEYNSYSPATGIFPARRAIAEYLSGDLHYQISPDDVYLTVGCKHAIEVIVKVLARPGANILLPRPGYPNYEAQAASHHLEFRHFDLLPERHWEVDLDSVKAVADDYTCHGYHQPWQSLRKCPHIRAFERGKSSQQIAETARKLGILVIADEVYGRLAFGSTQFVPMSFFASSVPVITLGSILKRWMVPGWRLGWLVISDPTGLIQKYGFPEAIKSTLSRSAVPDTFNQGAVPQILGKTPEDFFTKITNILRENSNVCYDKLKEIPCIKCPQKPEGSMFAMVKLDLSWLEDIVDDTEFCLKLAKEESVIILPGIAVGLQNWLRITFAVEHSLLGDGLGRLKAFYLRHAKKK